MLSLQVGCNRIVVGLIKETEQRFFLLLEVNYLAICLDNQLALYVAFMGKHWLGEITGKALHLLNMEQIALDRLLAIIQM